MDDVRHSGNDSDQVPNVIREMSRSFKVRVEEGSRNILGISIDDSDGRVKMNNSSLIVRMLRHFRIENC